VSISSKPAPKPTRWSQAFWDALRERRFLLQKCDACGKFTGYPKVFCPHCYSDSLSWVEASGKGKVYTYSTVVANPPSTFLGDLPYTIAIATLEEGPRFLAQLVGVPDDKILCDLPVRIGYAGGEEPLMMPYFEKDEG
jgi:uncharacterized OB-fold protein